MSFSKQEFLDCLNELGLSQIEAAKLLSVTPRTLNRWAEKPHEISGPAEQALRAWMCLQRHYLSWRPDGYAIEGDAEMLDKVVKKIGKKGGSKLPWKVDKEKGILKLESIWVKFYEFPNGRLCISSYGRTDKQVTKQVFEDDKDVFEDAVYAIWNIKRLGIAVASSISTIEDFV